MTTDSQGVPRPAVARRSVAAAAFGNAMEWYDFSVYAFFASYIAVNFFEQGDPTSALLHTFMVFGAGFVTRPLGALVVGIYGDKLGRKAALMLAIGTMGLGMFILAVAPPLAVIGVGAPILLLIGRLLQGFSAGGEIGGAAAYMIEHAPAEKRGLYASWLQASMGVSNLLAAIVGVGVTTVFSDETVQQWAWRIPFVIGLLIIPIGIYIRRQLPETEAFERTRAAARDEPTPNPIVTLCRDHPGQLVTGFLFSVLWTVCVYAFVIYLPTYYIALDLGYTSTESFAASLVGNVALIIGCLTAGRVADRIGARRLIVSSCVAMLLLPLPCLLWLHATPTLAVLLIVHTILCVIVSAFTGVAPSTLPRAFPASVRSTGLAVSYNLAAIFFAGFTPALMTWATAHVTVYAPALWVIVGTVACLVCLPALFRQIETVAAQEDRAAATSREAV